MFIVQRLGLGLHRFLSCPPRWLLRLFSAVFRALKRSLDHSAASRSQKNGQVSAASDSSEHPPPSPTHEHRNTPPDTNYFSASFLPPGIALHPYQYFGPSASRSSHDIGTMPIQDTLLLRNLSVRDLRARSPAPRTRSPSPIRLELSDDAPEAPANVAMHPIQYLSEAHRSLEPGTPQDVDYDRHNRHIPVPQTPTQYTIGPFTDPPSPLQPPDGWTAWLHPEGALYFLFEDFIPHGSTEVCVKRIFTDADIFERKSLSVITEAMNTVADFMRSRNTEVAACVDLVLNTFYYDGDTTMVDTTMGCQYYFVNHETQCVFWMDKAESSMFPVTAFLTGITSESRMHIVHELMAQYWQHCYIFPAKLEMTHKHVDKFRNIVLYSLEDLIVSPTSTVPWKVEQLTQMLNLADGFSKNIGSKHCDSICSLSRLMHHFVRDRVWNFHGERGVRLDSNQSIYPTEKPTMLVKLFNPLLFRGPASHLVRLNTIYTDGLIRHRFWGEFIARLTTEWQELTVFATVFLSANVGFLSIQSVDQGPTVNRSPAQIASYLSIGASLGTIVLCLQLLKQIRNRERDTPEEAAGFMQKHDHRSRGLQKLAILYSVPYATFMWSLVFFSVALCFMCFQDSSRVTRALVGALGAGVVALMFWCIFVLWEGSDWDWLERLFRAKNRCEEADVDAPVGEAPSSKLPTRRWQWPSILVRKPSTDSDETAVP
ncbi:hypothetical protein K438DRAFT_1831867 [Mycena galopus ATCC 62051]|nr:hypothetical protein K438DRAFT_1831867 [Mycena galopus ATCC 62051]